jgi:cysteine-rich repeat protein
VWGPRCGDGVLQSEHEECDDGNTSNRDSCDNTCKVIIG